MRKSILLQLIALTLIGGAAFAIHHRLASEGPTPAFRELEGSAMEYHRKFGEWPTDAQELLPYPDVASPLRSHLGKELDVRFEGRRDGSLILDYSGDYMGVRYHVRRVMESAPPDYKVRILP